MATNPAVLKEAKRRVAAGEPLEDSHQKAWDKEQRRVAGQKARRQVAVAEAPKAEDVVTAGLAKESPYPRQSRSRQDTGPTPVDSKSINGDLRHHDMIQDLADHISNRISEIETPANSIGVGKVAAHLKGVYDSLMSHQYNHKEGHILDAQKDLSTAARGIGNAEAEFGHAFPNEKLRPTATSPVAMGDVATAAATHYSTSETPGVGSKPDEAFTGTLPSVKKRVSKAERAALAEALPAKLKKLKSLNPAQNAKNRAAFEAKNPPAEPTPANDRMLREANRAKLSAVADIKRRYPEAPNGAPQATFDYHVNKATEALHAGQPIAQDTKSFLGNDVLYHVKRAFHQAKVSGGIKTDYGTKNTKTDGGYSGAELPNAPVEHTDTEVQTPSSEDAPGEVTLRPGRTARSGSMAEFTNGRA